MAMVALGAFFVCLKIVLTTTRRGVPVAVATPSNHTTTTSTNYTHTTAVIHTTASPSSSSPSSSPSRPPTRQIPTVSSASASAVDTSTSMDDDDDEFCERNGLHEIALLMANYSSPPGSASFQKLRHILQSTTEVTIDYPGVLLKSIFPNVISMIEGWRNPNGNGHRRTMHLKFHPNGEDWQEKMNQQQESQRGKLAGNREPPTNTTNTSSTPPVPIISSPLSTTMRIETSMIGNQQDRSYQTDQSRPRIILQPEQLDQFGSTYLPYLKACHDSPLCMIWDFSDAHLKWAQAHGIGDSFLLLPIMHQSRFGEDYYNPERETLKPLKDRDLSMVMFAAMTQRRLPIQNRILRDYKHRWGLYKYTSNYNIEAQKRDYKNAKVCMVVHSYTAKSAMEFHRLGEMAPSGCMPIIESVQDTLAMDIYQRCGGVVLADYDQILNVTDHALQAIHKEQHNKSHYFAGMAYRRNVTARAQWWSRKIQWPDLLNLILQEQ